VRTYVRITGVLFGLLVVAHVLRAIEEGPHLAREPIFLLTTSIGVAFAGWSWRLLQR
jgi:hypothetical protein